MIGAISAIDLARFEFAFTIPAHIIFPAFTIGLASVLAVLNGLWLWCRDEAYRRLFDRWKTIFAVAFGMGVVSGFVMSHQFGTHWSVFSDEAGPTLGPLMGYEVLTAFFGGRVPRHHAVRPRESGRPPAHGGHGHRRAGHRDVCVLDPERQLLDADPAGLFDQRRRPVRPRGLVGDCLQLVVPLPAGAHGAGGLPDHGLHPEYLARWFGWPLGAWSALVPVLLALAVWQLRAGLRSEDHLRPLLATVGLFVLSYVGLGVSFYPNLVPPALSIAEAAAPDSSLRFLRVGAVVLIPIILAYTAYSYSVFRGKVRPGDGYH
jgi:hypothetical protein